MHLRRLHAYALHTRDTLFTPAMRAPALQHPRSIEGDARGKWRPAGRNCRRRHENMHGGEEVASMQAVGRDDDGAAVRCTLLELWCAPRAAGPLLTTSRGHMSKPETCTCGRLRLSAPPRTERRTMWRR